MSQDLVEAARLYKLAAAQGDADAQCSLGNTDARSGVLHAHCCLGNLYFRGKGVSQDFVEAARLYKLAADQGYADAQYLLGVVQLFRLAAAQGHAGAQCNLGFIYASGNSVAQDFVEAARLWRLAVAQGDAGAQCNLAFLYFNGNSVAQDFVEAARLWRLAAAQGAADAHAGLARLASERAYISVCCMGCGATHKLKTCGKCNVARFCGAECQRRAHAEHKPHCKRWEAEAAGAEP
jgi:hypothetical protein